ncbi:MAG: hypothetical protein ACK58X_20545, partial [Planctomycetota bacterium]
MSATHIAIALSALFVAAASLPGQCSSWLPGQDLPGANGEVFASAAWDPDGPGPQPAGIVFAGSFSIAGGVSVRSVAFYDPATTAWSPLGVVAGTVNAVHVRPNGELVIAGSFSIADGVTVNRVARWSGSAWAPIGAGFD